MFSIHIYTSAIHLASSSLFPCRYSCNCSAKNTRDGLKLARLGMRTNEATRSGSLAVFGISCFVIFWLFNGTVHALA